MLAVKPGSLSGGDEELRAVGVGAGVGHREGADEVLDLEVFVGELGAVDALASHSIALCDVSSLNHERRDDSVENRVFETEALFAGRERAEVLDGLGDGLAEEADDNAADGLAADGDVEGDLVGDFLVVLGLNARSSGAGRSEENVDEQSDNAEENENTHQDLAGS